jgi:hypothetical protein
MVILSSGNVGIGTSSPQSLLDVELSASGGLGAVISVGNSAATATSNETSIGFKASSAFISGYYSARISSIMTSGSVIDNAMVFYTYGSGTAPAGAERMRITSGGNVLIGTTTDGGQKLQVRGASGTVARITDGTNNLDFYCGSGLNEIAATTSLLLTTNGATRLTIASTGAATFSSSVTATGFFESSDSRLKTLIQDNYQTKGIASITPKLYTKNGKVELGYYAQDFVGVLDSAVSKGSDDMLSLSYREVLVAKVYALEQEIKELKAKMN